MGRLASVLVRMILPRLPLLLVVAISLAFPSTSTRSVHAVHARSADDQITHHGGRPRPNCTHDSSQDFPQIFGEDQLGNGAILLHILASLYLSGCIGYICHVYFVPSLELICTEWKLPPDVAGATIMAAGTSLPELFAAIMGTFVTEDDTGTGAIVGSAAFNIYAILALCSFLAPEEGVKIAWFPVLRDGFYWAVCMLVLIAVVIDGKLLWWESLILSLMYVVYAILMSFNTLISESVQSFLRKQFTFLNFGDDENTEDSECLEFEPLNTPQEENELNRNTGHTQPNGSLSGDKRHGVKSKKKKVKKKESEKNAFNKDTTSLYGTSEAQAEYIEEALKQKKTDSETASHHNFFNGEDTDPSWCSILYPPENWAMLLIWILGLPVITLSCFTIPDCRKPGIRRKLYLLTFFMAAVWCALSCYLLFWVVSVIGDFFGIPDIVMGYTLLAIGTSLPDAVSSAIVSKHGYVDMAIGNISGSNTFEILVCLGMVWFARSVSHGEPVLLDTRGFQILSSVLLVAFLLSLLALGLNDWVLNKKVGIIALIIYVTFLIVGTITEQIMDKSLEKPPCENVQSYTQEGV